MWVKVQEVPLSIAALLLTTADEELQNTRFIVKRDNMVYFATYDTFGDVMPDDLGLEDLVELWKLIEQQEE